jgi:hypothetical protein
MRFVSLVPDATGWCRHTESAGAIFVFLGRAAAGAASVFGVGLERNGWVQRRGIDGVGLNWKQSAEW